MHELLDARLNQIAGHLGGQEPEGPDLEAAVDGLLADLREWRWLSVVAERAVRAYPHPAPIRDADLPRLHAYLSEFTSLCRDSLRQLRPEAAVEAPALAVIVCGPHVQITLGSDPVLPGVAVPFEVGVSCPLPGAN